jgi:hypothetical protein
MRTKVSSELPYDLKLAWSFPYGPYFVSPKNSINNIANRHITIMKMAETFRMDGREAWTAWNKVWSDENPCPSLIETKTNKYCSIRWVHSYQNHISLKRMRCLYMIIFFKNLHSPRWNAKYTLWWYKPQWHNHICSICFESTKMYTISLWSIQMIHSFVFLPFSSLIQSIW